MRTKANFAVKTISWFHLSIAQRSLAGTALSADNLSATSTVVSPTHQRELGAARLAHCNSLVGNPDWSSIAHLSLEPQDGVEVVQGDKGCFPAPVLFYGTVQGVQPTVPLFHIPEEHKLLTCKFANSHLCEYLAFNVQLLTLLVMLNSF